MSNDSKMVQTCLSGTTISSSVQEEQEEHKENPIKHPQRENLLLNVLRIFF